MMRKNITIKLTIYSLFAFLGFAIISSCSKEAGHSIGTAVVKTATIQFFVQGDSTHTLTYPKDTIAFISVATPQTIITGKNGQRVLNFNLNVKANIKGTFPINTFQITIPQQNGSLTTSNSNIGTVTIDSINATKGYIAGSFTTSVKTSTSDSSKVAGVFSIQQ